jgi:tetratricopeptide (TPR) repeat protein
MKPFTNKLLWIGSIGILVLIPVTGKPTMAEVNVIPHSPAAEPLLVDLPPKTKPVPEKDSIAARDHYVQGLKYFQGNNYEDALKEWRAAEKLDPDNINIRTGLARLQLLLPKTKHFKAAPRKSL